MSFLKRFQWLVIVMLAAVVVMNFGRGATGNAAQDPASLDRRISMLEQRFYSLESSMNRLQQLVAAQRSPDAPAKSSDREMTLLSQDLQRLQFRLIEVECGLVKLDERTATARRSGEPKSTDPCRLNTGAPLRLSSRP